MFWGKPNTHVNGNTYNDSDAGAQSGSDAISMSLANDINKQWTGSSASSLFLNLTYIVLHPKLGPYSF